MDPPEGRSGDQRAWPPLKLTEKNIRERLGFSTIAMPGDEPIGARHIAAIREVGITRVEICGLHAPTHYDYHDRSQVSEIIAECDKQGVAVVAVHGPGLPYDSPYEEVRKAVVKEAVTAARVAEEMGASVFVAHFNTSERSERTVTEVLTQLDGSPVKLTVENGNDLRDFVAFVDRVGSDRFGIVVDIGHTRDEDGINPFIKKERAREAIALCGYRLLHLHLHDFVDGDHYPPFDGTVQWDELFAGLQDLGYSGEIMFEAIARTSLDDTLSKTAAFPAEFLKRYGDRLPHPDSQSTG